MSSDGFHVSETRVRFKLLTMSILLSGAVARKAHLSVNYELPDNQPDGSNRFELVCIFFSAERS